MLAYSGLYWFVLVYAGLYWSILVCIGLYWPILVYVGLYWSILVCTGFHRVSEELQFVGRCLAVNPKSYGAWHHRSWVLRSHPDPTKEGGVCDRMLEADPRNFHAWEHRRALWSALGSAPLGSPLGSAPLGSSPLGSPLGSVSPPDAELSFCSSLLSRDFSNFSAWHHRGELLRKHGRHGDSHVLKGELELVQSAVFTDPQDHSPWVYLRCLMARASPPPRVIGVHLDVEDGAASVTFSRPIASAPQLTLYGRPVTPWSSAERHGRPSCTWVCKLPADLATPLAENEPIRAACSHGSAHWEVELTPKGQGEAWWAEPLVPQELFWPEVGVAEPSIMAELIGACRELLDMEPHSRGCLLTLLLLLAATDPMGSQEEMRRCLQALEEADPLRIGFVADMASRAELVLGLLGEGAEPEELRLPYKVLDVSSNQIETLQGVPPLPRLRELRLDGNPISHASALSPLAACPRLSVLRLADTPLATSPDAASRLAELLPRVAVVLS
ncbi:geranylgeranyl transferase type-2 subunit alpha isoform X2 [Excalfactoria chinensis]|uniref:geranylgeranyl transferase type-2 subunit alpha isoform X2 n=1 Tax=Excalfactoria chinensis TaxID=46218 RepID=UPI003B3B4338